MNIHYCLPVIKSTQEEVLHTIKTYNDEYTFFEVWLDYIEDLKSDFIDTLINSQKKKLILLFRRQNLETPTMESSLREHIIKKLEDAKVLVDFDVEQQKDLLDTVKGKKLQLITSFHDYTHTPTDNILNDVLERMASYNPTIYKISTLCQTEEDALRLMQLLLQLKKDEKRCIILGMGEQGSITRIFGTLWGNEMIFAPKEASEASAPGQLTKHDLESIFTIITRKEQA